MNQQAISNQQSAVSLKSQWQLLKAES